MSPTVTLQPRTAAHAEELFAVLAEPGLYEFVEEDPPVSVEALRQKFLRSESRRSPDGTEHWLNWVVRDASGRVAGYVQATIEASAETNIAYVFGSAFWGRGIASTAVDAMLQILVTEFGVTTFLVVAERANARSVRLAERLGFTPAPPELSARRGVAPGDVLLQLLIRPPPPGSRRRPP
jgi:[ribosomal protein S5]-alanine N-acetyltransferase